MTDCHDFVFADGKLVGRFEDMYREASTTPWHQDEQEGWLDVDITIDLLKRYALFSTIRDYGCGLGYFLDILVRRLGNADLHGCGYDVSLTACEAAKALFPNHTFEKLDLQAPPIGRRRSKDRATVPDLHIIRGTLWHLVPELKNCVENICSRTKPGDLLCVSQNFPPLDSEFIGKDVLPNPDAVQAAFDDCFEVDRSV